jgi:hypothetical protein
MDFKKATDALFETVSHDDLALVLKSSVAAIRQARLDPTAKAHRSAPKDWEPAVLKLAEARARHFARLAENIRKRVGKAS